MAAPGRESSPPHRQAQREESHAQDHYSAVSMKYHTAFFYTGEYERWQMECILPRLNLRPDHMLVDIGGGTGRFATLLHGAAELQQPVLCVDPSEEMLAEAAKIPGVETKCSGALEFAQTETFFDRALLKEVVHHISDSDLKKTYSGIHRQLKPGGIVLTCTRPHVVQYPFFAASHEVWSRQQKPMEHYAEIMRAAGFEQVHCEVLEYAVTIEKKWWLDMVQSRFWSTLSLEYFSEDELAAGLEEIKSTYADQETISFAEQMVFITATKTESGDRG